MRDDEQHRTKRLGNDREPSCPIWYHGCFLEHKENQSPEQDCRQCKSSNEIAFQGSLCFPEFASLEHCLGREACSEMKGKGVFHCVVIALEFLIRLFVAFHLLLGDTIPVISSYTSLCTH